MPEFVARRMLFVGQDQFGAEGYFYRLRVGSPNPDLTVAGNQHARDVPPEPIKDMTHPPSPLRDVRFHPSYTKTVLSDHMARLYRAHEGDWILVTLVDSATGHEHGFFTKVKKIISSDEPHYRELLMHISAKDMLHDFSYPTTVLRHGPHELPVQATQSRGRCYLRKSVAKDDV